MRFSKLGPGLAWAVAWIWSGVSVAQTLEDASAQLLASHPQIRAGEANVLAAEQGVNRAVAGYLPSVALRGSYGYERIDSPARRAVEGVASSMSAQTAAVTVTQSLFNGFRTQAQHESASANVGLSAAELESTRQTVLFEGVSTYLDVMRRRQQVSLALSNVRTIQQQLNLEDERVQRGSGIAVDVLLAKSRLQTAKERLVAFEGEMENAVSRYIQVFDIVPQPDMMAVPALPVDLLPDDINLAVKSALAENPSVIRSNRSVDLADIQKEIARADYYPNLDLIGELAYENDLAGVLGPRRDMTIAVQASWEIFSGFATDANVAEASFLHKASLDNHLFVNRKVVEEVAIAWQNLKTARDRVLLLENGVNIASEVHGSFRQLRDAGQATAFEVLDSQNEIFDAAINLESAEFDARVAVYQLLRAMGRLTIGNIRGVGDDRPVSEIMRELRMREEAASGLLQEAGLTRDDDRPAAADLGAPAGVVGGAEPVPATTAVAPMDVDAPSEPVVGADVAVQRGDEPVAPAATPELAARTEAALAAPSPPAVTTPRVVPDAAPTVTEAAPSADLAEGEPGTGVDAAAVVPPTSPVPATTPTTANRERLVDGDLSEADAAFIDRSLQRHWSYD